MLCLLFNNGPADFHPDEPGKVEQLEEGPHEFLHPHLMLRGAEAVRLVGRPFGVRTVVAGRSASALFVAGAAALLALAAGDGRAGPTLGAGLAVATLPDAVAAGHYLKEDAALLLGVAAWAACGVAWTGGRRSLRFAVLLGLAGGLAAAGKWVGAVWPVVGVLLVAATAPRDRWRAAGATLAAAGGVVAVVNLPGLLDPAAVGSGIAYEARHVTGDHGGLIYDAARFHARHLLLGLAPPVLALAAAEAGRRLWRRAGPGPVLPLMAAGAFVLVAPSSIAHGRYVLPVAAILAALAGAGCFRLGGAKLGAVLLIVLLAWQGGRTIDLLARFADDPRTGLAAWIDANLPPEAVIAADDYARLDPGDLRQRLVDPADPAATHAVIVDLRYARFLDRLIGPTPAAAEDHARRRALYRARLARPPLLAHAAPAVRADFAGPTIRVVALD